TKCVRKYNPDFIQYGFVNGGSEEEPRARCVECGLTLSNEALKPSKLQRHLETKQPTKENGCTDLPRTEELVLPAAVDMCREMIGEATAKKLLTIPLSNDTVSHRIADMASEIQQQLLERIKSSTFFSLQMDEYMDVTNAALLLVFVRYRWDSSLHEDILFCGELPTPAMNGLDWQNCVGVCNDDAASMTGRHHGVIRQILECAPEAKWTHCFLHRESLAAKKMSPEFHEVMTICVKTINFIKNNAVNSRCFAKLCEDIEADHVQLLYHSEVRWRSRGLVLKKNLLLHITMPTQKTATYFLLQTKFKLSRGNFFCGQRGPRKRRWTCFHFLTQSLSTSHSWQRNLMSTFLRIPERDTWILDPFSVDPTGNDVALPSHLESQLLEVSTDSTLKLQWGKLDQGSFWIAVSKEYPCLALRAVKLLLPFTTTYLCESGFSIVATTKTKARNRLRTTLKATLRVSLSPIPPRLDLIVSQRQAQVSH
uniref:HAT C-terminal dimerisation domain-containing protein n=1 Tax=Seriola lalandi dorsalis TaxID=1841481 RepID=A0A3B4YCD7_SERLL